MMIKNRLFSCKKPIQWLLNIYFLTIACGLPLVFSNGYYNITKTKALYYLISTAILLILFVLGLVLCKAWKRSAANQNSVLKTTDLDICMALLGVSVLLSACLSSYPQTVWLGRFERFQGAVTLLSYVLVYFIISRFYKISKVAIWFTCISFGIVCALAVLQALSIDPLGLYRGVDEKYKQAFLSTIGNINFFSSYICLMLPILIVQFCYERKWKKVLSGFLLAIAGCGAAVSSSDSFWLGFVAVLILLPFCLSNDYNHLASCFLAFLIIFVSAFLLLQTASFPFIKPSEGWGLLLRPAISFALVLLLLLIFFLIKKEFLSLKAFRRFYLVLCSSFMLALCFFIVICNTVGFAPLDAFLKFSNAWGTYRGEIWKQCFSLFGSFSWKQKLFGVGPEALRYYTQAPGILGQRVLDQAHNEFLQYFLTSGLFGGVSYLSMVVFAVIKAMKHKGNNLFAAAFFCAVAAYWAQSIVNIAQPFTTPLLFLFLSVFAGVQGCEITTSEPEKRQRNNSNCLYC